MAKHDNADCQGFMVPVTVENVPDVELYGELCVPKGRTPSAVQLLVHGTTYNHNYWDWPEDPDMHSHVRASRLRHFQRRPVGRRQKHQARFAFGDACGHGRYAPPKSSASSALEPSAVTVFPKSSISAARSRPLMDGSRRRCTMT